MSNSLNVFEFEDYRVFLKTYLSDEANQASGARKRLLLSTGISSSLLTQILSEAKQLSTEQAYEIALHIGFTEKETDYFLNLVEIGRAGSVKLKERLRKKMLEMQNESQQISAQVNRNIILTEEQKVLYYSNWLYTAIRNLIATPYGKSIQTLADKLGVPESKVEGVVQFLLESNLVTRGAESFDHKPGYTHLDASHPMILRHHQNWRQRAVHRMDHYKENHFHYTCPMAISNEAAKVLRASLLDQIKSLNATLQNHPEEPETAFCLNIDFFEY
ncbi:TIGR02147 family protein [Bdellovibrio sp. HCB2-146]|uniref:TIGR02147 family protein n=1 Tax=Bdellovibrio sp. HCB2-146 TaxID=3394362 RepID=UPI0039BC6F8C